jgi:hypothetical protein
VQCCVHKQADAGMIRVDKKHVLIPVRKGDNVVTVADTSARWKCSNARSLPSADSTSSARNAKLQTELRNWRRCKKCISLFAEMRTGVGRM